MIYIKAHKTLETHNTRKLEIKALPESMKNVKKKRVQLYSTAMMV